VTAIQWAQYGIITGGQDRKYKVTDTHRKHATLTNALQIWDEYGRLSMSSAPQLSSITSIVACDKQYFIVAGFDWIRVCDQTGVRENFQDFYTSC